MSFLVWIIAAVCIGMIAYPLMQIVPSGQQKQQIALRQYAMTKGLKVQIKKPDLPKEMQQQIDALMRCVSYFKAADNNALSSTYLAVRTQYHDDWYWLDGRRPEAEVLANILEYFQSIPDFIPAIELSRAGSSLYWAEQGSNDDIDEIVHILSNLNSKLSK